MNLYYYKRASGEYVFSPNRIYGNKAAVLHLYEMRKAGYTVHRLYLDLEKDFEFIKDHFFTPEYWEGRTWTMEEAA